MTATLQFVYTSWMNRILAMDPGLVNLKSALRGTLAVVISFFTVSFVTEQFYQHAQVATLPFVAVIIAMMGSLTVNDPSQREQKWTFLILPFPAVAAFVISILTESVPAARIAGFLSITFLAVYLRRYGPRGIAIGMVTFMAYFCPLFFPVHVASIPAGIEAVVIATVTTYLIRFLILPDRPQKDLKRYIKSFQLTVQDLLSELGHELKGLATVSESMRSVYILKSRWRIQRRLTRLNELGLTLETFLGSTDSKVGKPQSESLQMQLFERELSVRQFLDFISIWVSAGPIPPAHLELAAERVFAAAMKSRAPMSAQAESLLAELPELEQALQAVIRSEVPAVTVSTTANSVAEELTKVAATAPPIQGAGMNVNTRQAIQATLATALASAIGVSISTNRWYWASLTAFVVFAGATRGETLHRAFLRVLGTLGGLVIGFLLAYSLSGHHRLEWAVVIAAVFIAIYAARAAFGFWTASMFTLMLAVLYDILGQLTEQILILRLEETVAGAVIGALVAGLVMPISTRATVRQSLSRFLDSVANTLEELPKKVSSPFARRDLVRRLREVDRELMTLRASALPVIGRISILRKGDLPATVYEASVLAHFLRHLATYTGPMKVLTDDDVALRCERLALKARILSKHLSKHFAENTVEAVSRLPGAQWPDAGGDIPSHWFTRMDQILGSLRQASLFQRKS